MILFDSSSEYPSVTKENDMLAFFQRSHGFYTSMIIYVSAPEGKFYEIDLVCVYIYICLLMNLCVFICLLCGVFLPEFLW